jgi:hypothetical protein
MFHLDILVLDCHQNFTDIEVAYSLGKGDFLYRVRIAPGGAQWIILARQR